ncbi:2-C-methyl-D-erythritol 4-phosphate cytidylyltransferase [Longivirga aurantiaca]|uniref:2-C-methyl-D-erythritol 4-phosphate cytidylyltransferase n=1 Tax=Longivirga aurantiaca TaxID=1837743 RepID=A0ABW1SWX0_9ACTN
MTLTAAVVPAAGRGERLGPGAPKALRLLGGVPMLVHAVRALATARSVDLVVVAAPEDGVGDVVALLAEHNLLDASPGVAPSMVVSGGETRQDSVARALVSLPAEVDVVLVHDAARPLVPSTLIDAVSAAVRAGADAVVPGIPVADTIKAVDADGGVVATLDRGALRAIQTPQGFRRTVLTSAHAASDPDAPATDDAGLVEALGVEVLVVPGDEEAFKVTRPIDLVLAEAVLARRRAAGVVS